MWPSAFCNENYTVVIPEPQSRPEPVSMPPASDSSESTDMPYCPSCGSAIRTNEPLCPPCSAKSFHLNTSTRSLGVELEFIYSTPTGLDPLYEWGDFHDDGSICNFAEDEYPIEFASKVLVGDQVPACIDALHSALITAGARVNRSCGLHIHLGTQGHDTNYQRANIRNWWLALEPLIFHLVPQSRRHNQYCRRASSFSVPLGDLHDWYNTRYTAMNIQAYDEHGTYEIRLHQGTTSAVRIKNWCYFLLHFFDNLRHVPCTAERLAEFAALSNRGKLLFLFQNAKLPLWLRKDLVRRERLYRYRTAPTRNLYLGKLPRHRQWQATSSVVPDLTT